MCLLGSAGSCGGRGAGHTCRREEEEEEEPCRREKGGILAAAFRRNPVPPLPLRPLPAARSTRSKTRTPRPDLPLLLLPRQRAILSTPGLGAGRKAGRGFEKRRGKSIFSFLFAPLALQPSSFFKKKKLNLISYLSWDDYFMALAFLSAQRSKDPNKQVGACIVSPDRIILGIGYNGFPRGCADSKLPWAKKAASGGALATKYPYVCHAEMNAVLNKNAASVAGATLYVTMFPCNECSKLLIQAGIGEVVFYEDKQADADGGGGLRPSSPPSGAASGGILPAESYAASRTLLALARVRTRQHAPAEALELRVAPLDEAGKGRGRKKGGGVLHAKAS